MKNGSVASLFVCGALALAQPAASEELIKLASTSPPQSSTVTLGLTPWVDKVNAAGKGIVKIEMLHGGTIANHLNYYQRTMDDVVQMAYGSHSNTPGKFNRTTVVDIPFNADRSEPGSTALWRLYKTGLLNEEYADIVPVLLFIYPQVGVHTKSEPKSWETLQGLKLSTTSPITTAVIERLGGTPLSLSIIENYEGVQRGTIDGFLLPWPTFPSFKFGEVTKFHIDTNLGTNAGLVMMARKKFDSYSAEVRRFLEAQFGEAESRRWGKYYDDQQDAGLAMTEKAGGHKIVRPSAELKAKWAERLKPITDDWLQRTPNGPKIMETWVKLRAEAEAGK